MRYFFTGKIEKKEKGYMIQIPFNVWEVCKQREVIQADEFIALMEGRSLEELDRQRDEVLQEQKGEAGLNAAENSATEPVQEAVKLAETAPEEVPVSVEPEQAESVTETKITAEEEK